MICFFYFRELLEEIRNLREVREAAADQPNAPSADPAQMEELKGLRQKKDELELRMSSLQETRKELMSQLEGLMSILKVSFSWIFYCPSIMGWLHVWYAPFVE